MQQNINYLVNRALSHIMMKSNKIILRSIKILYDLKYSKIYVLY